MRVRGVVAAGAGIAVAAVGHALDVTGQLPFVHETESVRWGMSPTQVVVWLAAAGALAGLAASSRLLVVGPPVAIAISAAPELIARRDPGAIGEPGALLGAALQLVLLAAVVLLAAAFERRPARLSRPRLQPPAHRPPPPLRRRSWCVLVDATAAARAPPFVGCF